MFGMLLRLSGVLVFFVLGLRSGGTPMNQGRRRLALKGNAISEAMDLARELDPRTTHHDRGAKLAQALLDLVFDPDSNGLDGMLRLFREHGLAREADGWIGNPDPPSLLPSQVEQVLGGAILQRLADRAGMPRSTAAAGAAFAIPKIVGAATRDGRIPARRPDWLTCPSVNRPERRFSSSALLLVCLTLLLAAELLMYGTCRARGPLFDAAAEVRKANARTLASLTRLPPSASLPEIAASLNLLVIDFAPGSDRIPEVTKPVLDRAALALCGRPGSKLEIGAHTAGDSEPASLSVERAEAIRNYLIGQGVRPAMLIAKGYGASRPVDTNQTDAGRFHNRRVEFQIIPSDNRPEDR